MKIILFTLSLIFLFFNSGFSQNHEITGQLKDNVTKDVIVFCYVHVLNQSDSLLTTCVTDNDGYFSIWINSGQYKFVFEQLGYIPDTTELTTVTTDKFLDVFKLEPDVNMIDQVTITGDASQNYIDRDVQIVTSDLKIGAANTYDVLGKVQGLSYDRYNDEIKVDNDNNIILLVNGVEKDFSYIKNIDPERMQKIEIIRAPSGKYAIAGYTAVINIILKSNYRGTDIHYHDNHLMNFFQAKNSSSQIHNAGLTANYTNKKLNIYTSYRYDFTNLFLIIDRTQKFNDSSSYEYTPHDDIPNFVTKEKKHNITFGTDYFISPKQTISYELTYNFTPESGNSSVSDFDVLFNSNQLSNNSLYNLTDKSNNTTFNNSLFYVANFNDRNSLNASYTFSKYDVLKSSTTLFDSTSFFQQNKDQQNYSAFSLEYTHSFSQKLDINIGYGNTWRELENTVNFDENLLSENDQSFGYTDFRNQLYSYLSYRPVNMFSLKIGIAAENANLKHDNISRNYFIYMPHVDLMFKPATVFDVTLKYRSKSQYPSINQANPLMSINEWQMLSVGNPNLEPANENTISLRMNILGGVMFIEPYFRFTKNYIIDVINIQTDGTLLSTYENSGLYKRRGIKTSIVIPFSKSLFLQTSIDAHKEQISFDGINHSVTNYPFSNNFIYQNQKTKTVVGLVYQKEIRKIITWHGYIKGYNDFWGLLFQQSMLKDKLSLTLIYMLPTNFGVEYNQGSYSKTDFYEETINYNIDILKNLFIVQLSYRFVKGSEIKKIDKDIDVQTGDGKTGLF